MAGNIFAKDRAIITLTSTGSSLTTGSAGAAGTDLDMRSSVAGNSQGDFDARFELICQWATITGITAALPIAELYAVPKMDGTNAPDIDTTAGTSFIAGAMYLGPFVCSKAPTANTDMRFVSPTVSLHPTLYTIYILNRSGQTISANWTLKAVDAQAQYS